jgi:hypothetical protein
MKITIEAVDHVIAQTGASYEEAMDVLKNTDGDPEVAIEVIKARRRVYGGEGAPQDDSLKGKASRTVDSILASVKQVLAEGNATKIQVVRNGRTMVSIPLTFGVAGLMLGLSAAPLAVLASALAVYGLDCQVRIVRKDGTSKTF